MVEALTSGSHRRFSCFVALSDPPAPGARGAIVALPARLGPRGVEEVLRPSLSRQEQTLLENAWTEPRLS
jgi:malate/lactate dehydrogenase